MPENSESPPISMTGRADIPLSSPRKNSRTALLFFAASIGIASFAFVGHAKAEAPYRDIFIRSVQTKGSAANQDFVEIRNDEDCALDLSGWKLRKRTQSGSESSVKVFDSASILPPGKIFLWANSSDGFADHLNADEESTSTLTDNNSLALFDASDAIVDSLSWGSVSQPFQSGEPNTRNPGANEMVVRTSKTGDPNIEPTTLPIGHNSSSEDADICGVSKDRAGNAAVVLSEILADPSGNDAEGEFIEIENRSERQIDLSGWKLRDNSKTGKYVFPVGTSLDSESFLAVFRANFVFALNNSDETVTLEDAKGNIADSVSWETSREDVSLARDGDRWRNTKFLTPGAKNRFGSDPSAKTSVPKEGFAGIPIEFFAKIKDRDRDKTKVVWDFGDGHKSYKENTSHVFEKTGKYIVKLSYTDGVSDKSKTFRIKIGRYVAPKVRIVSLVPNPDGADTGRESVLIQNKSKKKVDLKGWIIATKSRFKTKRYVNHRITETLVVKPGESVRLTRENAAFSLGNTRQYIELRSPQGKTVQSIRYKLEKSAPENAEFFKSPDSLWQWNIPAEIDRTENN